MATPLTKEHLDQALERLATKDDLARLEASVATQSSIDQLATQVHASFSDLQSSVDRYLKRTEAWHDEFNVLHARFTRVVHLLDQKGVIKEEETHLA